MTPLVLTAVVAVALLVTGWGGQRLVRGTVPALARVPRIAVALLGLGLLFWVAAALSLGPMLAWVGSLPRILPEGASLVCERCLQSANPFASKPLSANALAWAPPAVVLLAATALMVIVLLVLGTLRVLRDRRRTARFAASVRARATAATVLGTPVLLVQDKDPLAFALPARLGGIVMSTATLDMLGNDELRSVLAHEREHLKQRHHVIGQLVTALTAHLQWIPLIAALAAAIDEYLEIAADDSARREAGTPALAAALLKLGAPTCSASNGRSAMPAVLHMAGPGRILHLVTPDTGRFPLRTVLALGGAMGTFGLVAAGVYVPYVAVLLAGCW